MNGLEGEGCPLIWLWRRSRGYSTCPYRRKPYLPGMRMSRGYSTSSCTWTGISPASADPRWPSPGCIFLVDADMWALILSIVCICLGAPICFDLWALFVSDISRLWFFVHFFLCSLVCLPKCSYGCLQITIHQNSWNGLAIRPITKFGDWTVMENCRSWRLILWLKDHQQHSQT